MGFTYFVEVFRSFVQNRLKESVILFFQIFFYNCEKI